MSVEDSASWLKFKCAEVLKNDFSEFRRKYGALNIGVAPKFVDGKSTGETAIVFYMPEKKPLGKLKVSQVIPKMIEGCMTDVVEFKTSDYVLGDTEPSKRDPEIQRRIAGGVRSER